MNDHGRPTPARIGNDGEAFIDTQDDWDCLPVWRKLDRISDSLDHGGTHVEGHHVCEHLDEIARDLERHCRRNGIVL